MLKRLLLIALLQYFNLFAYTERWKDMTAEILKLYSIQLEMSDDKA